MGRQAAAAAVALCAVGWGANQFAPLVVAYQTVAGVPAAAAQAMFVLYAVGLVPGLFLGGGLSDRHGRRAVVLAALALSIASSLVLMAGGSGQTWLYIGRLIAGLASGIGFGAGAAWVKETLEGHRGPRVAVIAMTTGFGLGPLVAGLVAAAAAGSLVLPYLPHLAIAVPAALLVAAVGGRGAPTTAARPDPHPPGPGLLADRRFTRIVVPLAPWVFLTASVALAVLPASVAHDAGGHEVLFSALVTPLPALTGIAVQRLTARIHHRLRALLATGLAGAAVGLLVGAAAVALDSLVAVVVSCAVLGASYGVCQTAGLTQTAALSRPGRLGRNTALYQALTYIGYLAPLPIVLLTAWVALPVVLAALAALAVATWWSSDRIARATADGASGPSPTGA